MFEGMRFYVAQAVCGYVTRIYLAIQGHEDAALRTVWVRQKWLL